MIDGHRVELDSNGNILPRDLRFGGPRPRYAALPLHDDGFISLGSLKKERNRSTSRLTELESARSKCEELEGKIERLERRIAELEQQHPSSMDEMIDRWQTSEEGMAAISELARPATKARYSMTFQHFDSYLSEVPADKKWDGLPWPHDDIGVTDQNVPYYIVDGPPPPVTVDAEEEGEPGEVIIA
ncbi:hypothetical protein Dimus_020912 [Dionaea muscipula]